MADDGEAIDVFDESADEEDISRFDDWLNNTWENLGEMETPLTTAQRLIVKENLGLLLNREKWERHVRNFLASVPEDTRENYRIHFDHAQISRSDFQRYRFPCSVTFWHSRFTGGRVSFEEAEFDNGNVIFTYVDFGNGYMNFSGAQFGDGNVIFSEAKFGSGGVDFGEVDFGAGGVEFSGAAFGDGDTIFFNANFGCGSLDFYRTQLGIGEVSFHQASFAGTELLFDQCELEGRLDFTDWNNEGGQIAKISMRGVHFPEVVDFSGRAFEAPPDFVGSRFVVPPDLSDVKVGSPKMDGGVFGWFQKAADPGDIARYRKLKAMAIAVNDHEKELEFFAHETRAKRWHEQGILASIISGIYEMLSDYGQSLKRPLVWWVIFAALFGLFYGATGMGPWRASLHSITAGLPFLIAFMGAPATDSGAQELLTIVQLTLSLILIFLFFLGLRNRFKIR